MIRPLTSCVSPEGGGHGVTWKDMKKRTRNNAQKYMNDRQDQTYLPTVLVQKVEDMVLHQCSAQEI